MAVQPGFLRPGQNPHCWFSHVAAHTRFIVIFSLRMCNDIFTIIQLCMFNVMSGFVNMASAIFMLTLSVLNANIVILCHTFFVVHEVQSAIVATCMLNGSSQYVILRFDHFGFHTRSVKMPIHILTSLL